MGSKTEAHKRLIRAVIIVLIMPFTIGAGLVLGYLLCIGIGYVFFDNSDQLLTRQNDRGFIETAGLVIRIGCAILCAIAPWLIFCFFNPDEKKRRSRNDSTPTIIQI